MRASLEGVGGEDKTSGLPSKTVAWYAWK